MPAGEFLQDWSDFSDGIRFHVCIGRDPQVDSDGTAEFADSSRVGEFNCFVAGGQHPRRRNPNRFKE